MNKLDRSLFRSMMRRVQATHTEIYFQPALRMKEFQQKYVEIPVSMPGFLNWYR
jgi:hypothetical protein